MYSKLGLCFDAISNPEISRFSHGTPSISMTSVRIMKTTVTKCIIIKKPTILMKTKIA